MWYHALNRGNRREAVFHKDEDYAAFVKAMVDARVRLPVDVLGYCLMPNHFHLVLRLGSGGHTTFCRAESRNDVCPSFRSCLEKQN